MFANPLGPRELFFAGSHTWPMEAGQDYAPLLYSAGAGAAQPAYGFAGGNRAMFLDTGTTQGNESHLYFEKGGMNRYPPDGIDAALIIRFLFNLQAVDNNMSFGFWNGTQPQFSATKWAGVDIFAISSGIQWNMADGANLSAVSGPGSQNGNSNGYYKCDIAKWHLGELIFTRQFTQFKVDDDPKSRTRGNAFLETPIQAGVNVATRNQSGGRVYSYLGPVSYRYDTAPPL